MTSSIPLQLVRGTLVGSTEATFVVSPTQSDLELNAAAAAATAGAVQPGAPAAAAKASSGDAVVTRSPR